MDRFHGWLSRGKLAIRFPHYTEWAFWAKKRPSGSSTRHLWDGLDLLALANRVLTLLLTAGVMQDAFGREPNPFAEAAGSVR